jgi:hypothetical protein
MRHTTKSMIPAAVDLHRIQKLPTASGVPSVSTICVNIRGWITTESVVIVKKHIRI